MALRPRDIGYPRRLLDLPSPPDPIWVEGDKSCLAVPAVTIVGTRRLTAYGERVARELGRACASADFVIVSGLAPGIDSAAHRGAVDVNGRTIAVLGEGISLCLATMAARYRELVPRICARGALLSEYEPTFTARPWTFVKRNATMAALGSAVVVVEAGERSGALITANDAVRLGRPVYAVPGPLGSAASVGTNALIAAGRARALVTPEGLLTDLGSTVAKPRPVSDPILDALAAGPLDVDALWRAVRGDRDDLSAALTRLLLSGRIAFTSDGRYRRL